LRGDYAHHLRLPGHSSLIEMAPSAFLFPIDMATLQVLGLPVMKWMVRPPVLFETSPVFTW